MSLLRVSAILLLLASLSQASAGERFQPGVELNPFRLLLGQDVRAISAGFSLFDKAGHAEIAFPLFVSLYDDDPDGGVYKDGGSYGPDRYQVIDLDVHYRRFMTRRVGGFYLSGFLRSSYLRGTLLEGQGETGSEIKLGLGIGMGYRVLFPTNVYWGMGIITGRYVVGKSEKFAYAPMMVTDDSRYILDIELLKVGWLF
jgi:hypothetical protein